MIRTEDKRNQIYNEFDEDSRNNWFDLTQKKILHGIDSLYFTVYLREPYNNVDFFKKLDTYKDLVDGENVYLENLDLHITSLTFRQYTYCFTKEDNFKIFVAKKVPISNFPPIIVHLSANLLWEVGEYIALEKAYEYVSRLISPHYTVLHVKENRIDYAYHTNYMRDLESFLNVNKLNSMQVSNFTRGRLDFALVGDDKTDFDYIAFGNRTSNNLYLRMYNKTKEVIEKGYKAFFYPIWLKNGLISKYDMYCYEKAFLKKSYRWLTLARLEFYLEFGEDVNIKKRCHGILSGYEKLEHDDLERFANTITPRPTLITNIEYETKRKFYQSLDESMEFLALITNTEYKALDRLFRLMDNKILIHRLLTTDVFRLVDMKDTKHTRKRNKDVLPFWKLLQDLKLTSYSPDSNLVRKYNRDLNIELIKNRIVNSMSSLSLYLNNENEQDILQDTIDFLTLLSENDTQKAFSYKNKKANLLKGKFETLDNLEVRKRFALLDKEDGSYIE